MLECNICFVIFHINKLTSSLSGLVLVSSQQKKQKAEGVFYLKNLFQARVELLILIFFGKSLCVFFFFSQNHTFWEAGF